MHYLIYSFQQPYEIGTVIIPYFTVENIDAEKVEWLHKDQTGRMGQSGDLNLGSSNSRERGLHHNTASLAEEY